MRRWTLGQPGVRAAVIVTPTRPAVFGAAGFVLLRCFFTLVDPRNTLIPDRYVPEAGFAGPVVSALVLALAVLAGCGEDSGDVGNDVADTDAADTGTADADDTDIADTDTSRADATDTGTADADAASDGALDSAGSDSAADGGADTDTSCNSCVYDYCPDYDICEAAVLLEPGAPLTDQDTSVNTVMGDCATSASGPGGPNLYYTLTLPAGKSTRLVAAPTNPQEAAVVRILDDCRATQAEDSARGGSLTDGRATLCSRNDGAESRDVIVAVGRYSGEQQRLTLEFDLSAELRDFEDGCL